MEKGCIQMTLIQLDNYGPWTLSLGPGREPYLQVLQSELYAELQRLFTFRGGLVFHCRFDNMLALTNGLSLSDHAEIQKRISELFPVTVSMGVGLGGSPAEAQNRASRAVQNRGSSRHEGRRAVLEVEGSVESGRDCPVQIAHVDVDDVSRLTDSVSAYDLFVSMLRVHGALTEEFLRHGSLVFFIGGDNFLVVSSGVTEEDYREALRNVSEKTGLKMKAGIGVGRSAKGALELASGALDKIRGSRFSSDRRQGSPVILIESRL
ncbi:MAG: GTP cyclohydrolase IIa [Candidatus Bathyarchaeia archaeon]